MGIDVGTSSTRVSLYAQDGTLVASASGAYPTHRPGNGVVEQDPLDWLEALTNCVAQLPLASHDLLGIGLCGQTPTMVLVNDAGSPVYPAISWQDTRSAEEATELESAFGDPVQLVGTSLAWSASNMPAKLLWLSRHEPDAVARTRYVLQAKDFIVQALTGNIVTDAWSSKGLCNVLTGQPISALLQRTGWSDGVCPPVKTGWSSAGEVTAFAEDTFGLPAGTTVSVGWSDAFTQILASGSFESNSAFVFTGTSSIVGSPLSGSTATASGLFTVPKTCAPLPLLYGPTQSGGASLEWAARLLDVDVEGLIELASRSQDDPPVFVPYLSGERAPLWNTRVRGLIAGLDAAHGREEFARSVVAGVSGAAREILALVSEATGQRPTHVEVVGRGVGNAAWESMLLADLGLDLRFHDDADLSVRGAAILGAAAAGEDVGAASERLRGSTHFASANVDQQYRVTANVRAFRTASQAAVTFSERGESNV
jgi:xylulokinase